MQNKFNNLQEQVNSVPKKEYFNNKDFKEFRENILKNYTRKYEIKKLFSTQILFNTYESYFENLNQLKKYLKKNEYIDYDYNFNKNKNRFNVLKIKAKNSFVNESYSYCSEKQDLLKIVYKYDNFSNFEKLIKNILKEEPKDNVQFIIKVKHDIYQNKDYKKIGKLIKDNITLENGILNKNPIYFDIEINDKTFHHFQEIVQNLYEDSFHYLRFFDFTLNYNDLKKISLEELNSFEFYFSFIERWQTGTMTDDKNSLLVDRSFSPSVKPSLFIKENGDVFINEKFQKNNKYKLFNFEEDFGKTGEDMPFYENNLLWQVLLITPDNFIKHTQTNFDYVLFPDLLDYYYNMEENQSIQNLSPEIEVLHQIIYRVFNKYN